jgi:cbb3-type cytochrome oxidase subunit 3
MKKDDAMTDDTANTLLMYILLIGVVYIACSLVRRWWRR